MLLKLCVLFVLMGSSFCADIPAGLVEQKSARIVGGSASPITNYPYQVSLQSNGFHRCAGAIYSVNIIITAAHCLVDASIQTLRVRAGSAYWSSDGVLVEVAKLKLHEAFDANTMKNDIALMRLSSSLKPSLTIKSIDLAIRMPASGAIAFVSGWGSTSNDVNQLTKTLQATTVRIVERQQCASSAYGYGNAIRESMICAGANGYGACQGDNGAPLVANNLLVGIASWGIGCGYAKYPHVFASIPELSSWIYSNIGAMYD